MRKFGSTNTLPVASFWLGLFVALAAIMVGSRLAWAAMVVGSDNLWVTGQISLTRKAELLQQWPYSRGQDCDEMLAALNPLDETSGPQCVVETPVGSVDDTGKLVHAKQDEPADITIDFPTSINSDGSANMVTSPVQFVKSNSPGRYIIVAGDSKLADGMISPSKVGIYQHLSRDDFFEYSREDGSKAYMLDPNAVDWLIDYEYQELSFIPSSLAVSQNGRWITGVLYNNDETLNTKTRYPLVVYDTTSNEVQMLDLLDPVMTGGDTPSQRGTAVSNDGKTVVTNMVRRQTSLYDVHSCSFNMYQDYKLWIQHSGTMPRTWCSPRLLWYGWGITPPAEDEDYRKPAQVLKSYPYIDQNIETPLGMRFIDDTTLDFTGIDISAYTNKNQIQPKKVRKYRLHVETPAPPNTDPLPPNPDEDPGADPEDAEPGKPIDVNRPMLLGLGDSYISGEGAYNYRKSQLGAEYEYDTDKGNNKCHTSEVSYPYLLGKKYFETYASVACSGAMTDDVITKSEKYVGQVEDGIKISDRKDTEALVSNFAPGYIDQIKFVEKYKPDVMLLSVGGNDIGFSDIVTLCVLTSREPCFQTKPERRELVAHINRMHDTLKDKYKKLLTASPGSSLYVMGYPEVVKVGGNCGLNVHMDADEVRFADQLVTYINMVIARAAEAAGAQYINVSDAFRGHRLCEQTKTPAVNGLTLGNDILGMIGKESYHPTAFGHELLARAIETKTAGFTKPMPKPHDEGPMTVNDMEGIIYDADGTSATEYIRYTVRTALGLEDVSIVDKAIELKVETKLFGVRPGTMYHIVFHSEPIEVDSGLTDEEGNVVTSFIVPRSVTPGVHVLHIQTTDDMGNDIDVQKTVYVRASETDYDGDGVPNSQSQCLAVQDSGIDLDKDGLDDACDGVIIAPDDVPEASSNEAPNTNSTHLTGQDTGTEPRKQPGVINHAATLTNVVSLTNLGAKQSVAKALFAAYPTATNTGYAEKAGLQNMASLPTNGPLIAPANRQGTDSQKEPKHPGSPSNYIVVGLLMAVAVGSIAITKLLGHMVETDKPGTGL